MEEVKMKINYENKNEMNISYGESVCVSVYIFHAMLWKPILNDSILKWQGNFQ